MRFKGTDTYLTSESLRSAVDCALVLERPLLVKGEPGTGKTLLAEAISSALGLQLLTWNVKSTTRAQDGLYVYDAVQRLHDSRFNDHDVKDIDDPFDFAEDGSKRGGAEVDLFQITEYRERLQKRIGS